ncbi:MAG: amidohydrolase [Bacillota bacterium]|nr:amidohydrolase [Bacillota bacterium]
MAATYLLKSKNIFDSVKDKPYPGIVVIEGKKITGVYPEEDLDKYVDADTKVIDYGEKMILPGFIDSHMHAGWAMDFVDETFCVDLGPARSFEECMELMKEFGEKNPDCQVIFGVNFNFFNLDEYIVPTNKLLDQYFPDKPAMIMTWDVHTYYANTAAINAAGFTKDTPDPNGGIEKDENGELTGCFNDTAAFAIGKITEREPEKRKASLRVFMNKLNSVGVTSIGDVYPCGNNKPYGLFKSMEDELTTRIHFYPELLTFDMKDLDEYKNTYNSDVLQFAGLKNLIDGVLTVWTAWMLEPYTNKPETAGFPAVPAEEVKAKIMEACAAGCNVRIHTIGDKAVRYVLDCFEEAEKKYGKLDRRHNMEHIEYINPADIPRFAELGVVANMHFVHCTYYVDDAIKYLGPEREKYCFNWRAIKDTGAIIGTGTDFPVVLDFNPMIGVFQAITRRRTDGYPEGGWLPEQCLTLAEALQIYTYGGAQALNRDDDLGTLEAGKLADLVVLDQNLFDIEDPMDILNVKPVMTMVGGEVVYEK